MKCYRRCLWKKCTERKSDLHVEREGVLIDFDFATMWKPLETSNPLYIVERRV